MTLSVVTHAAPYFVLAINSTWRTGEAWVGHPLAFAASLMIAFLVLSWLRTQMAVGAKTFGRDFEV